MAGRSSTVPTVLHIEDDPLWARVVARMLSRWPEVCPIGFTTNGKDGFALCCAKHPAIVLLDLRLPDGDGFRLAGQLAALSVAPQILILTCRADELALFRAWSGPFAGLVWKTNQCATHLQTAFKALASGRRYFPTEVLATVHRFRRSPDAFHKLLSKRELSLIDAFVHGDSDTAIAAENRIARETVHSHRQHIMAKAGVHRTEELMIWGMEKGFGSPLQPPAPPGAEA